MGDPLPLMGDPLFKMRGIVINKIILKPFIHKVQRSMGTINKWIKPSSKPCVGPYTILTINSYTPPPVFVNFKIQPDTKK